MFWSLCVSIIVCVMVANAQPLSCKEDIHCSGGYFCEKHANVCRECLQCSDHKREPPKRDINNACIKSIGNCGPCFDGYVNIYGKVTKGKCVLSNFFEFGTGLRYAFVWMIAAFISVLIVAGFVYVLRHTDVFRIVAYYNPAPATITQPGDVMPATALSYQHLLKYLLHFEKDLDNK